MYACIIITHKYFTVLHTSSICIFSDYVSLSEVQLSLFTVPKTRYALILIFNVWDTYLMEHHKGVTLK